MNSEKRASVKFSLGELAERLGIPKGVDLRGVVMYDYGTKVCGGDDDNDNDNAVGIDVTLCGEGLPEDCYLRPHSIRHLSQGEFDALVQTGAPKVMHKTLHGVGGADSKEFSVTFVMEEGIELTAHIEATNGQA